MVHASSSRRRLACVFALAAGCGHAPSGAPDDASAPTSDADAASEADGPGTSSDAAPPPDAGTDGPTVTIATGALRGTSSGGAASWKGIPYAQPPTGPRRWRAPAPAAAWSGTRDASRYGNACVQTDATGVVGDEDCLVLNVWAPADFAGRSLPVIVFVHGGGWELGSGNLAVYDGGYLAEHGPAVVVTLNYRLGVFGFLARTDLAAENAQHAAGNFGLLDQIAALQWVRQNIRAFGGDPSRVLLWGQSAGGWSTLMLLTAPPAAGLFARAFAESGGTSARVLADAEAYGAAFATRAGCPPSAPLTCLRAMPAPAVQNVLPTGWWAPVVDGVVLPRPVLATFAAGTQAHVPLMIGTTGAEFAYPGIEATPSVTAIHTESDYEAALASNFGAPNVAAILALYPASAFRSPRDAYVATVTDAYMTCATRRIARTISTSQTQPVWRYLYTHTDSGGPSAVYGPGHFLDVPYWFDNFDAGGLTPDAAERALGRDMATYLTQFAATGDPNGGGSGAVGWPMYLADVDPVVQLGAPPTEVDGVRTAKCNLWDTVYPGEW